MDLLLEFRRRRLIQTAALYVAVAWGGTEILTFLVDSLWGEEPAQLASKYLSILFIAGFPVAMYLAWSRNLGRTARRFVSAAVLAVVLIATLVWIVPDDRSGPRSHQVASGSIRSLAVLPLDNLSGDSSQDYFAAGMTEALIAELSQLGEFRVISRTSIMRYAETDKSVPEIANELGVDAIVEGSILRSGDQVRITAQLIEARTDHHVWADTFDGEMKDVLALQQRAANAIAFGIGAEMGTPILQDKQASHVNPEAFDAYLAARMAGIGARGDAVDAIRLSENVIEIDPAFAPGYAYLSDLYGYLALTSNVTQGDAYLRARQYARKALEIDPYLAYARIAMGRVYYQFEWDWEAAEAEFKRGLQLDPNHSDGLTLYGSFRVLIHNDCDGGLEILEEARARDPFNPGVHFDLAVYYFHCRRPDDSLRHINRALQLKPDFMRARMIVAWNLVLKQQNIEASDLCHDLIARLDGEFEVMLYSSCAWVHLTAGRPDAAQPLIDRMESPPEGVAIDPMYFSWLRLAQGDKDGALDALEESLRQRSSNLIFLQTVPAFDAIRNDPRFVAVVDQMNFPNLKSGLSN